MSHHHQSVAEIVIGVVGLGVLVIFAAAIDSQKQRRLADPTDTDVIPLETLPGVAVISGEAQWIVTIRRQSGAVHSERSVTGPAADAINVALSTFRRAGIGAVGVQSNTAHHLRFARLFYGYGPRGQMKGGNVGSATISRVG